jgi:outer membrane receptor protein involved in Fe transport
VKPTFVVFRRRCTGGRPWPLIGGLLAASFATGAEPQLLRLDSVVVSPSKFAAVEGIAGSTHALELGRLQALPNTGDDLFRGLARLPGLAADDISAQFWVRGAPHSEVRTRLDGVDLIEPFHLKDAQGALAIVDPGAIAWLELATGGFAADHGDRLAGVLTMETRSDPRRRTALNLSLTGSGTSAQGTFGEHRGRWLVTARRGFPELALRASGRPRVSGLPRRDGQGGMGNRPRGGALRAPPDRRRPPPLHASGLPCPHQPVRQPLRLAAVAPRPDLGPAE